MKIVFKNLGDNDLKEIKNIQTDVTIQFNKSVAGKFGSNYDANSILVKKILIDKINSIEIIKILNTGNIKLVEYVYFLPLTNSCIKILATSAEDDLILMDPILNKIISSIKIK